MPILKQIEFIQSDEESTQSTSDADETYELPTDFERDELDVSEFRETRYTDFAKPHIGHTTDLFCSTKQGLDMYTKACDFSSLLCIAKSDVSINAGSGLYIIAKNNNLNIKKGPITWFSGKIVFADKSDMEQKLLRCYTVGLGSLMRNAAQVILSDPDDYNLLGCAHLANHSTNPNCKLTYVQSTDDVIATILELKKDTVIHQGDALELVFNYGKSAITVHGIEDDCNYIPMPKPIEQLQDILSQEYQNDVVSYKRKAPVIEELDDTMDYYKYCSMPLYVAMIELSTAIDSLKNSLESRKKMPRHHLEYTTIQLTELIKRFLPSSSFKVLNIYEMGGVFNPAKMAEDYFFIQLNPALDEFKWIFAYHSRRESRLYFFDPEGLPLEKVKRSWFPIELKDISIHFCHSWFVYSRYAKTSEHQKTGVICVEVAKMISQGLTLESNLIFKTEFLLAEQWGSVGREVVHFNLSLPHVPQLKELSELLVDYPQKIPTNCTEDRALALSTILREQNTSEVTVAPMSSPLSFFKEAETSPLQTALKHHQETLQLSPKDIVRIEENASDEQKDEMLKLCTSLVWSNTTVSAQKLKKQIKEQINEIFNSPSREALMYYSNRLEITPDEILKIEETASVQQKEEILKLCTTLIWLNDPVSEQKLKEQVKAILDVESMSPCL